MLCGLALKASVNMVSNALAVKDFIYNVYHVMFVTPTYLVANICILFFQAHTVFVPECVWSYGTLS